MPVKLNLDHGSNSKKENWKIRLSKLFPILIFSAALHLLILFFIALLPGKEKEPKEKVIVSDVKEFVKKVVQDDVPELPDNGLEIDYDPLPLGDYTPTPSSSSSEIEKTLDIDNSSETLIVCPLDDFREPFSPPSIDYQKLITIGFNSKTTKKTLPNVYSNRTGDKRIKALMQNNGDQKTQQAVENALLWLSHHQEKDGSWNAEKYEGRQHAKSTHAVTTACALLPFFGAGYDKNHRKYGKQIKNGVRFLNRTLKNNINKKTLGSNYGAAIILMALSESHIFNPKTTTQNNANSIVKFFFDQYLENPGQGWGYYAAGNDLSVTGWVSLSLKSAKAANLRHMQSKDMKFIETSYKKWLDQVSDKTTGMGSYRPGHKPSHNMTYVAMFVKQSLGFNNNDPFLKLASQNVIKWANLNNTFQNNRTKNIYGAYYGTLAAFQSKGQVWSNWNPIMKRSLVCSQREGKPSELGGSWDPTHDHTGEIGGRIYSTALLALTLEVYYRYQQLN